MELTGQATIDPKFQGKVPLEMNCTCGETRYFLVDSVHHQGYTICPKCLTKQLVVECVKCQSGYSIPANDNIVNLVENTFKCDVCKQTNALPPEVNTVKFENFDEKELPKEIFGKSLLEIVWESIKSLFRG